MAALCWTALTLGLFLSVGTSQAEVDINSLNSVVYWLMDTYRPNGPNYESDEKNVPGMYSVAMTIPKLGNKYDVKKVIEADTADAVKKAFKRCEVYVGTRVVAATVLMWPSLLKLCPDKPIQFPKLLSDCSGKPSTWAELHQMCPEKIDVKLEEHAEHRTLQTFNASVISDRIAFNQDDLMVLYVFKSPCVGRCVNEWQQENILSLVDNLRNWDNRALVFTHPFIPNKVSGSTTVEDYTKTALERLGQKFGLTNIYRCDYSVTCIRCSDDGTTVKNGCLTVNPEPGPSGP